MQKKLTKQALKLKLVQSFFIILFNMKLRIKEYRKRKGIIQQEMADQLHVTKTTYRNYEDGYTQPDFETLIKIATILDCSIDQLLGFREDYITISKDVYNRLKSIADQLNIILK